MLKKFNPLTMKRIINKVALASIAVSAVLGCAKEQTPDSGTDRPDVKEKVTVTVELPDALGTKVSFGDDGTALKTAWEKTDVIRIVSDKGESETYSVKELDGKRAVFEGNELEGTTFTVIYPSSFETADAASARRYSGQVQDGNASTAHLGLNAMVSGLSSCENVSFAGEGVKLNGAVKLRVKLPESVVNVTGISLSAASDIFFLDNAGTAGCSSLELGLRNVDLSQDHILTAYMMSSWSEAEIAAGTELTVTVSADGAAMKKSFTAASALALAGGCVNTIQLNGEDWTYVLNGSGTEADPYLLAGTADLLAMKPALKKGETVFFKMTEDIDMSGIDNWQPLNPADPYDLGIDFNGDGHVLSGLKSGGVTYASFFGVLYGACYDVTFSDATIVGGNGTGCGIIGGYIGTVGKPGHVYNVKVSGGSVTSHLAGCPAGGLGGVASEATVEDCVLNGVSVTSDAKGANVGGICGVARKSTISGCTVDATVISSAAEIDKSSRLSAGGIVGKTENDDVQKIENCVAKGSVEISAGTSFCYTGGIVGWAVTDKIELTGCESYADVSSSCDRTGGIVGHWQGGMLSGCSSYGNVSAKGKNYVGGIAGIASAATTIENCKSSGTVTGNDYCGGIVGGHENSLTVRRCASSATLNCSSSVGGILGQSQNDKAVTVENCLFSGSFTYGNQRIGGIVGELGKGTSVRNCLVTGSVKGWAGVGGIVGRSAAGKWNAKDSGYGNTVEGCILWAETVTATRPDADGGSSGIIVGFTGTKNTLKNCWRKPSATLAANYGSEVYDQEDADESNPLAINPVPAKYTYIYPYHGKAAAAGATASDVARTVGWDESVWNLSGTEPALK